MRYGYKHRPMLKSALALALGSLLSTTAAADFIPGFAIQPLQDFGYNDSVVRDINIHGVSVGDSISGTAFDAEQQPVFWDPMGNATILDFDPYPAVDYQTIRAINDAGLMVGVTDNKGAVVWVDQVSTQIPNAGGVYDINNANQIIGTAKGLTSERRAAIWNDLQVSLLGGEPSGFDSSATAINNIGQVVGNMSTTIDVSIPVTWQNNQIERLGYLPGFETRARVVSINDNGQMVGVSNQDTSNRAVIWENGLIADLGTLGGANAGAVKINNAGQIIGVADTASGQQHPFLWQDGVMYDLAPAVCADVSNCSVVVNAINDLGQIAYIVKDGYFNQLAYTLTIAEGALANLPSVNAPLNFVTPVGAEPPVLVTPIPEEADVQIRMSASAIAITSGGEIRYQIAVSNVGPTPAKDIIITDALPKNVELIPERSTLDNCSVESSKVICRYQQLNVGSYIYVALTVKHISGKRIRNTASVESTTRDPDLVNNKTSFVTQAYR